MDYEYQYRGYELIPILHVKIKNLEIKLRAAEQAEVVKTRESINMRESIERVLDKELLNKSKHNVDFIRSEIQKCEVMIIEMQRDKRRKFMLSLADLVWLRY